MMTVISWVYEEVNTAVQQASMYPIRPDETPTWEFCGTAGKEEICFLLALLRGQDSMWSCWQPLYCEVKHLRKELTQRKREMEKTLLSPDPVI